MRCACKRSVKTLGSSTLPLFALSSPTESKCRVLQASEDEGPLHKAVTQYSGSYVLSTDCTGSHWRARATRRRAAGPGTWCWWCARHFMRALSAAATTCSLLSRCFFNLLFICCDVPDPGN